MILKQQFSTFGRNIALVLLLLISSVSFASAEEATHHEEEEFSVGDMILDHVMDAHDWHIADWKGKAISIPLPIIIYDKEEGKLHAFMSSKFHHGHDSYKGFKLTTKPETISVMDAETNMLVEKTIAKNKIVPVVEGSMDIDASKAMPLDFSITKSVTGIFVSAVLLLLIFISVGRAYKRRPDEAPKGLQGAIEPLIVFIRDDVAKSAIGVKHYARFMPFLLTVFFFIFISNLTGLIPIFPGGAPVTNSVSVTLVLALATFILTSINGTKAYWGHMINMPGVPWWLKFPIPLMPLVEILGMFTKPFVLMVRLFANILAGHIVILGFVSLVFIFGAINQWAGLGASVLSVSFSLFISMLELLVAFIQAYVFTLLSAVYLGMALDEGH
jgi:F-type H+-transporting ATPase subunit a